jgi:hypothetical protein
VPEIDGDGVWSRPGCWARFVIPAGNARNVPGVAAAAQPRRAPTMGAGKARACLTSRFAQVAVANEKPQVNHVTGARCKRRLWQLPRVLLRHGGQPAALPCPAPVRRDPLRTLRRRLRQRQVKDTDRLPMPASGTVGHQAVRRVGHARHGHRDPEDRGLERNLGSVGEPGTPCGCPQRRPGLRTCPYASAADGRATAAAASRVAAVRETQRAAGPRAASAVMMAGEIARPKPVDS